MPRLYINYRIGLVVWVIMLIAIIVPIVGLGVYASGSAPLAFLPVFFSLLLPLVFLLVLPGVLLRQDSTIRGASSNDNRVAPLVIAQPNPAEALAPGATLQMTRTTPRGAIVRAGAGVVVLAVILIALSEFLVALAFAPQLFAAQLNGVSSETPRWLAWFFALAPLVMWGGFVVYQYWFLARQGQLTISVDDQGITLKQNLSRPQFMPWDDIHVWIRGTGNSSDAYLVTYGLIGYHHRLFMQFNTVYNLRMARAKPMLAISYSGGIDQYQTQARQLLATIAARGQVPLRTFPQGFYGPGVRRTLPFAQLTTTDIAALPVAHPSLLPSLPAVQAMQMQPGPLTLRQRNQLPANVLLIGTLLIILIVLVIILIPLDLITLNYTSIAFNFFPLIIVLVLLLLRLRFSINTSISADAQGIRGSALNRKIMIPWQRVRYWVVEPPATNHPHELIYGIFSDGPTITWRVPIIAGNDPQSVTQRAYAESFHAMIAARTGQPPRQLPVH